MTGTTLRTTAYGHAATEALHCAVAEAKAGDALAPVTVVVPTNYVGVAARRALGASGVGPGALGPLTPAGVGVAGVTFLTAFRLAEMLGTAALTGAGRRPVSTPVQAAAIRAELDRAPGIFAPVAHHPATEEALVETSRELSACTDAQLQSLASAGPRTADVVRICRAARRALGADWYDEHDLMAAAAAAVAAGSPVVADLGPIVVHLPQDLSTPAIDLLHALAARVPVTVIAGITGNERADRAVVTLVRAFGLDPGDLPAVAEPCATHIVSASDPDDEVRAAVRLVVGAMRDGVRLDRMAVLFGATEPYARLVHEQLEAAGIPHNGAAVRTLAGSVVGRGLLGLLALPDRGFHRHDLMTLLASAPVRFRGKPVPSSRWERTSRKAGVVRGIDQWHERLERHAARTRHDLAAELAVTDREPRPARFEGELQSTEELLAFVTDLEPALEAGTRATTWRELATWAQGLVRDYLGNERARGSWPDDEVRAATKIDTALERLATLDAVGTAPTLEVFRRTLDLELAADLGRVGRLGDGLLMGHVALGMGLDLDRVFVCGLAEGIFPARVRDDSLLPDHDRAEADGALRLRADRVDDDRRRLLAALAAGRDVRVLLQPRGDLRRTSERMPSRFLLASAETLAGRPLTGEDLADLHTDWCTPVASFAAGLAHVAFPATEQEYRLRSLLDHERDGGRTAEHELCAADPVLAAGIECTTARASSEFTRFDGNISGAALRVPGVEGAAISPTRLERWARNPFDYYMQDILRVEVPELPEDVDELSPLERGSLIHDVLDEFFTTVIDRTGGAGFAGTWGDADRALMREIGLRHCGQFEELGVTGRRVFWHRDRTRILAELDHFLDVDGELRDELGLRTLATELQFGLDDAELPAIQIPLTDGRAVYLRGAADRVDRDADGGLWVIDYKTGGHFTIDESDPCAAGQRLQLPVYAHAARAGFGDADTPVGAAYWFVSTKGGWRWVPLVLDDAVTERFDTVVRTILDGIAAGVFPCVPAEPPWGSALRRTYTDPDARGIRDRAREWGRKQDDPAVQAYLRLVVAPDDTDAGTDDGDAGE